MYKRTPPCSVGRNRPWRGLERGTDRRPANRRLTNVQCWFLKSNRICGMTPDSWPP